MRVTVRVSQYVAVGTLCVHMEVRVEFHIHCPPQLLSILFSGQSFLTDCGLTGSARLAVHKTGNVCVSTPLVLRL